VKGLLSFLGRDRNRNERTEQAAIALGKGAPVLTVIAGSDQKRTNQYTNATVPEHRRVLTAAGEKYAVREAEQQSVAALDRESEVLLLATEEYRSTDDYLALRQSLRQDFASLKEGQTTAAVLLNLYKGTNKRVERKDGEEALSVNLWRRIVEGAVRAGASDIHIVLMDESQGAVILYRLNGKVMRRESLPMDHAKAAVGVAYNKLAAPGTTSEGNFIPGQQQFARIPYPDKENPQYNLRWQSIAVAGGLRIILRLLQTSASKNAQSAPLEENNQYSQDHSRTLYAGARRSKGLILVSGPTGSGKTTLLKALMTSAPNRHQKIQYSIEDPVEYKMFGVGQISLSSGDEDEALEAGRAVLRSDPDDLMVGEIRGVKMAALLKSMVLGGHLVMGSTHGSSAIESVARITEPEIGIPRSLFDGRNFLNLLVYQNLVPRLCDCCKVPASQASEEMFSAELKAVMRDRFELDPDRMFVTNPSGCEKCDYTGENGRTVICEVIRPDRTMRQLFKDGRDADAEDHWRRTRRAAFDQPDCTGKTYVEHGLYKVAAGMVDPVALDETEPLAEYEVVPLQEKAE
jgi:general secretion pathway protein E